MLIVIHAFLIEFLFRQFLQNDIDYPLSFFIPPDNQLKSASDPAARALAQRLSDPKLFWIDMKQKDTDVPQNSFRKLNID